MRQKVALPISVKKLNPGEYDQDMYKIKTIRGLKPMSTDVIHTLKIT